MAYKDGFVIEYVDRAWKINCYKCVYCSSDGQTCTKTGANLSKEANERWKACRFFELEGDYNTESMRARAEKVRSSAKGKKKSKAKNSKSNKKRNHNPHVVKPKTKKKSDTMPSANDLVGRRVTSPKHGKGKVVKADGNWISVVFLKEDRRIRFDARNAIKKGDLKL